MIASLGCQPGSLNNVVHLPDQTRFLHDFREFFGLLFASVTAVPWGPSTVEGYLHLLKAGGVDNGIAKFTIALF